MLSSDTSINEVDGWAEGVNIHNYTYNRVHMLLVPQTTSIDSEILFSIAGNILSNKRNRYYYIIL